MDGNDWYEYCRSNPLRYVDPDGRQPVRNQAGTVLGFVSIMNNSPSRIGLKKGVDAMNAIIYLGSATGFDPIATPYFNNRRNRYIYTRNGGWIDMVHFLFYAGVALENMNTGAIDPIKVAVNSGRLQEWIDTKKSPWSAYSYEDLPSDYYGAVFATQYFDPNSNLTLSEQIANFLYELGATTPEQAPNWGQLPDRDSRNAPIATNHSILPMFILR